MIIVNFWLAIEVMDEESGKAEDIEVPWPIKLDSFIDLDVSSPNAQRYAESIARKALLHDMYGDVSYDFKSLSGDILKLAEKLSTSKTKEAE